MKSERNPNPDSGEAVKPILITAADFARMMQISVRTLWRLCSAGQLIQPIRIGGNTRWRLDEVRQWIADDCPPTNDRT